MGLMSRARVLGYRTLRFADTVVGVFLPSAARRKLRRRRVVGMYTARHDSVSVVDPNARWAAVDPDLAGACPALVEFLTEVRDEEGKPRISSTLLLTAEDGLWKVALTDRAQPGGNFDYKLWRSGATVMEALKALDVSLQDGSADWRKFPKWQPQKKR
jgi:hypothetical protein